MKPRSPDSVGHILITLYLFLIDKLEEDSVGRWVGR